MSRSIESGFHSGEDSRDDQGATDLHFGNLFDQNENQAGDLYDLATGKVYDNSTEDPESLGFTVGDIIDEGEDDVWPEEYDEAFLAAYLADFARRYKAVGGETDDQTAETIYDKYELYEDER